MEIHVHPDEAQRQKVIEKYTFTIRYHSRGQGAISGIELDSPGKMGIAAETSSQALKTFLHDVMQMCGYLSDLPGMWYLPRPSFSTLSLTPAQMLDIYP